MARTTMTSLQELINAQNVKIANLQELVNTQDAKIAELAKAVTILTKLITDNSTTATKAEPQKKVAEPQKKAVEPQKKAPKEVAKNNKKTTNITPDTNKKDENYQGEKPRTREEALTQRYGAKEERREYAIRKANIKARAYEDTNALAKATGKWMPKSEWKKIFDKKFSEYLKAEGLA